jgi:copper homeostasis protein CutC
VFFTRPISGGLLAVAILLLSLAVLPMIRKRRGNFVE